MAALDFQLFFSQPVIIQEVFSWGVSEGIYDGPVADDARAGCKT
jgi:hypothetical protein